MKKKLIDAIQNDLFKLTNKKFTKKNIENEILPLFYYFHNSDKKMFLISGCQGIGKTTILQILENNYYKFFGKRVLALSLDDFYYNKNQRKLLSKIIHPHMLTRGVPGTHNIKEIMTIINKFKKLIYPIKLPVFNKLTDSRNSKKRIIKIKSDLLILEGWCCGAPPIKKKYLYKNINILEKKFDKNFIWRDYYNTKLKNEYFELFSKFDSLIYFKAPSFSHVFNWRLKQERYMKKNNTSKLGMNKKEIFEFVQHYEKITKWMMKILPKRSDLIITIGKNQKIKKISSV